MRDHCLPHLDTPYSFCSPLRDLSDLEAKLVPHLCWLKPRGLSYELCPAKSPSCLGTIDGLDQNRAITLVPVRCLCPPFWPLKENFWA